MLKNSQHDYTNSHIFLFAKNVIKTLEDMVEASFQLNDNSVQKTSFPNFLPIVAYIHFAGIIEGNYLLSLNETLAIKLIDAYEEGMSKDDIQEIRGEYGGFIKELLNIAVGQSIIELEKTFGNLSYNSCTSVYGEIEFPDFSATYITIEGKEEEMLCGFSLNLVRLKIGKKFEEARAENLRMGAELDIARRLQEMVLPSSQELTSVKDLDIAAFMQTADEVGGDYYDVIQASKGHILMTIGDITGHGLKSGVLAMMVQTTIHTLVTHGETKLIRFLDTINKIIYNNAQRMQTDKTMTLVLLDYYRGMLKISGQHEEIIVIRNNGSIELIDTLELGFFLGVERNITSLCSEINVILEPGEGMLLYTDGITEAMNSKDEMYGQEQLCNIITQHWDCSPEQIKGAVIEDVYQFIGKRKQLDDITLLIFKRQR
ncbi:PP2C family protein-serine/threonine phosphatase [Candidatus Halobeggiatoa sp. HSG11]|nr:PP2C family protein-serine/threonine phosphatase [Candidatus Halobeggiatoa sp. HSG11]